MTAITQHFSLEELGSHDGKPYPSGWVADRAVPLCETAEIIRTAWGEALMVISGYRSPAWNAHVGGAKLSQHMEGRALDLSPVHVANQPHADRCARLWNVVMELYNSGQLPYLGGIGRYDAWIHIDTRPRVHLAQWTGTGVGSETT